MEEIKIQFITLVNVILQQFPEQDRGILIFCFFFSPLVLGTIFNHWLMSRCVQHVLKERTNLSKEDIKALAFFYAFPYAYFWEYYPCRFIQILFEKLKRRKKHD